MEEIVLDGELTLDDYIDIVYRGKAVRLSPSLVNKVDYLREKVEKFTSVGKIVYGINTGFGALKNTIISSDHLRDIQRNIVRSHAVGVGEPLSEDLSRGILLLLLNSLSKGFSGVRSLLLFRLISMLNNNIHPVIPRWGSVGASGDLAPLAHAASALIGEGDVFFRGTKLKASEAFIIVGDEPSFELEAKEGLALLNGTHYMLAMLIDTFIKAKRLVDEYMSLFSVFMEVMETVSSPLDERIHLVRRDKYALKAASIIKEKLSGSKLVDRHPDIIQDSYSIRCFPQIVSPVFRALELAENFINNEINAVTDNPLVFEDTVLSGGNFHGAPLAWVAEALKIALSDLGNVSIAHMEWLLNPKYNKDRGLSPFLANDAGLESGFMIVQYMATSRMAQIRVLSHPASIDNYYTSALQEDVISLGSVSVDNLANVLKNLAYIIAGESVMIYKAIHIKGIYEDLSHHGKKWFDFYKDVIGSKILLGDWYIADILEILAKYYLEVR